MESKQMLERCVDFAKEKKAQDILALDLRGISIISDFFLIMTASNNRQAQAIADHLATESKKEDFAPERIEGYSDGRWILLDFGAVIVHVFLEDERQYYNLEKLWGDAVVESF